MHIIPATFIAAAFLLLFAVALMIAPNKQQKECPSARGLSYDRDLVQAICK